MNEQQKQVLIGGAFVVAVIVLGLGLALISNNQPANISSTTPLTAPVSVQEDHIRGVASSSVSVIEYGDFECPACGAYEPIVEQLAKTYGDRVTFVFRQYPLYQIHQNAMISAEATEAAANQGKFWEMHDIVYAKQSDWSELAPADAAKKFASYAQEIGLDVNQFNTDLTATSTVERVTKQLALGDNAQIDHTPTFFVNLKQIPNPPTYDAFSSIINSALSTSTTR